MSQSDKTRSAAGDYQPIGWHCRTPLDWGSSGIQGTGFFGHNGWMRNQITYDQRCPNCEPVFVRQPDPDQGEHRGS